jgi:lactoylglutathione lyase
MTAFRTPFPILYTGDPQRSLDFYREAFGFQLAFRWPAEGPLEYAYLTLAGAGLGIGRAKTPLHGRPVTATGPARFELCIYTDDTDAAADRLRGLGAPELLPPTTQPWGERLCYFADPDGNPLHVTCPVEQPSG